MKLPKYLAWVRTQPCVACGIWATEETPNTPHHIKGVCHLSGGSMKCTDLGVMPLCHMCHLNQHKHPTEQQVLWAFQTLDKAVEEGFLVIDSRA